LEFDPIISSHFHVVEVWVRSLGVLVVSIYSSKNRAWVSKEYEWGEDILVCKFLGIVFLNGFMHMMEVSQIVVVDMEGKTWRKILRPPGPAMSIHGDQGQLCLCIANIFHRFDLSIWILEDYGTSKWTLKHTVNMLQLFGLNNILLGFEAANANYIVIAVHLEWNLIFLVGEDKTLMAYDMSRIKFMSSLPRSSAILEVPGVFI
jgi:hypothetical protein